MTVSSNRWLGFRLEFLGSSLILAAAVFAVIERKNISPGIMGLSISYALQVCDNLQWLVRQLTTMETDAVSVERIREYSSVAAEAEWESAPNKVPPIDWPNAGKVHFRDYSTRYRPGLDLVLKEVNCKLRPGESIGIVGRTGAGKSSLTLALFRLVEPASGRIEVDGLNIVGMGLHDVRSRITILPQEPLLFSGSLRQNLDPLEQHSDDAIWRALEAAHLADWAREQSALLEHEVGEGGCNLSVGQRQLVCLGRALLRRSRVLVLDEATAAVDVETDRLVMETVRREFRGSTILIIAHRLATVMESDRVMVLDAGRVVELGSPSELLSKPESVFYGLAKDAGLVEGVGDEEGGESGGGSDGGGEMKKEDLS